MFERRSISYSKKKKFFSPSEKMIYFFEKMRRQTYFRTISSGEIPSISPISFNSSSIRLRLNEKEGSMMMKERKEGRKKLRLQ